VAGNSGCLHAVMSWSRSCIICFLDFRLLKEYMHFNACEKTFLNSTKRLGFNYQEDKKNLFISSPFHLICLCCYFTLPFSKESCQRGKISLKQSAILLPYHPSSLVLLHVTFLPLYWRSTIKGGVVSLFP